MGTKGNLMKTIGVVWDKNGEKILTGFAFAGLASSIFLTAKAAPKAIDVLNVAREELERDDISEEEVKELKKQTVIEEVKIWAPVAVSAILTGSCIIFAHSKSARKQAAMAAAYNLSEVALTEYKDKVRALLGEKKSTEISDAIAKDKIEANPVKESTIIFTGNGDYLCYDSTSGRYFKSTINDVKAAVNEMNNRLMTEMYLSLNEFYDYLNLPHISVGDEVGWSIEAPIVLTESYQAGEDGTPCLVIDFLKGPTPMFKSY